MKVDVGYLLRIMYFQTHMTNSTINIYHHLFSHGLPCHGWLWWVRLVSQ